MAKAAMNSSPRECATQLLKACSGNSELAVHLLLSGYEAKDERWLRREYLEPDSSDEIGARQLLADLLRSGLPLSTQIRYELALLIAPDEDENENAGDRKAVFVPRNPKRNPKALASKSRLNNRARTEVARWIWDHQRAKGCAEGDSIAAAEAHFKIPERTIRRFWPDYRQSFLQAK
jgi:hypothetical protein